MRVRRSTDLGALVAERREQRGLTQQQLADESGVTRLWLNKFERGNPGAAMYRVFYVLEALELRMDIEDAR